MQRKLVALILILAALAAALTLTTATSYAARRPAAPRPTREHTHTGISGRPAPVDAMLTLPHPKMVASTGAAGPRYAASVHVNSNATVSTNES